MSFSRFQRFAEFSWDACTRHRIYVANCYGQGQGTEDLSGACPTRWESGAGVRINSTGCYNVNYKYI
ncbi:hypothetical protein BDQ12DRAFT_678746 [Crucibulum laeve]|uniref:Uncharacterized protein n=1 Tax=Crucibulum laeve TaxID=68775 RepID=A0A5C3M8J7_9AGAR|nr:hypothetical protein BDQ12DRAFT_678746 [Crucibulum laeve]